MVFKSTNHFVSLYDFMKVVELNCENQRIVWLHRNTFYQLKSTTVCMKGIQKRYIRTSTRMTVRSSTRSSLSGRRCR